MENNRITTKKVKFNIIDAIVIAAFLIFIALFIFLLDPFALFQDDAIYREAYMTYVVEIKNVDKQIIENIRKNDNVFNSESAEPIGTITNVDTTPHYEQITFEGENGPQQIYSIVEGKEDVYITIYTPCTFENDVGYIVGSQQIAVGTFINICSSLFSGSGYCIDIQE